MDILSKIPLIKFGSSGIISILPIVDNFTGINILAISANKIKNWKNELRKYFNTPIKVLLFVKDPKACPIVELKCLTYSISSSVQLSSRHNNNAASGPLCTEKQGTHKKFEGSGFSPLAGNKFFESGVNA